MSGQAERTRAGRAIALSFALSTLASLALAVVYLLGGQPQVEGALLGVALGGLAVGLVLWAKNAMPTGPYVQERDDVAPAPRARAEVAESVQAVAVSIQRRRFLRRALAGALGALGFAALFPIRSLGEGPARALFRTRWAPGVRLVTPAGVLVRAENVHVGSVLTVFPHGHTDAGDSQALLIRLEPDEYEPAPGREEWSPLGFIAFSKICTHAGCPVGLYQRESKQLFCPCHQSVFAVLQGAKPTFGPATRPLPQLPLAVDDEGYLVARGDFPEPVGPGFWSRPRD